MNADSLRYRIRHTTSYRYSGRINLCHSLLHLVPRQVSDGSQWNESCRIDISPEPDYRSERFDYFGNPVEHFSIEQSHKSLEVTSEVIVHKRTIEDGDGGNAEPLGGIAWERLGIHLGDRPDSDLPAGTPSTPAAAPATSGAGAGAAGGDRFGHFLLPTPACPREPAVRDYLAPSLQPGADVMAVARNLMRRIYSDFTYTPGATNTTTPITEVLESRKGVCQDFAHLMIAALRCAGIPARYVSGYLETLPPPGKKKLRGADASHAWVEAWGPACGWQALDPTNNKPAGDRHIKIAHGRDYFDVQPLRGMFIGSGTQTLKVGVDVERMAPDDAAPPGDPA